MNWKSKKLFGGLLTVVLIAVGSPQFLPLVDPVTSMAFSVTEYGA